MQHLDLFSGIGGFALATEMVWDNVEHIFCENDLFCQEILKKHWPNSKIYGDIRTLTYADSSKRQTRESNELGNQESTDHLHVLLSSSPEDSLANPSPKLDEEKERQTTAISGQQWRGLFESSNHDGSSLKMLRDSLLGATVWYSNKCALTWKRKDTRYNRSLFQLAPSMRHTGEIESGLLPTARVGIEMLPTPDANDGARGATKVFNPKAKSQSGRTVVSAIGSGTGLRLAPNFVEYMMGFPIGWSDITIE